MSTSTPAPTDAWHFPRLELTPLQLANAVRRYSLPVPTKAQLRGELHCLRLQAAQTQRGIAALESRLAAFPSS